jgi:tRNA threonylcarbamoyladenosine biosynthesis protein TsaE
MVAPLSLCLPSPEATSGFATRLARLLRPGDALLLDGPVGAGKSYLARAIIHALQRDAGQPPEDVPSPTFTLIQTYAAGALEIWHADLYRLSEPDEVLELGLDTAWDTAVCLIEWPDRLGDAAPARAVHLTLGYDATHDDTRHVSAIGDAATLARLAPAFERIAP